MKLIKRADDFPVSFEPYFLLSVFFVNGRWLLEPHSGQALSIGTFLSYGPIHSCPHRKHLNVISCILTLNFRDRS